MQRRTLEESLFLQGVLSNLIRVLLKKGYRELVPRPFYWIFLHEESGHIVRISWDDAGDFDGIEMATI